MKRVWQIGLMVSVLLGWGAGLPVSGQSVSQAEPYITVTPSSLPSVSTTLGYTVEFAAIHIEQGNLTGTTTFELSGYDPSMFHLSATKMSSDQKSMDLIITYSPTAAGSHSAVLNIDNINHPSLFTSLTLRGMCTDPSLNPSVRVVPHELTSFRAVEGQEMLDTFKVVSSHCLDFVYMRVEHIQGAAFTIDGSMVGKNTTSDVVVRFAPTEPGDFESKVTVYSEGVESVEITLKGVGVKRAEGNIDWQTKFQWDESHPLTLLNETFDGIQHNKTVVLDGWQNVAAVDERPWWGFNEATTTPARGTGKYAKATAYQYGKASTGTWEMFLVTPALDYKNAEGKIFTFSVMGEYMPDEDNPAGLEIYYVDATGGKAVFQSLTESFVFPSTSVDNNVWVTYFLNLRPYAETMADVFHIAFRYIGPNGGEGAVTYYIDDVSWGRTDLPEILVNTTSIIDSTSYVNQEKILAEIDVVGKNLTNDIRLGLAGPNYNRFNLSAGHLSKDGGKFSVSFLGEEAGVHEAYIVLTSKGAAEVYIPMAVLCHKAMGIEAVEPTDIHLQKELRNGQVIILRGDNQYTILGTKIK